jgi:uncharacterized phiE125 gp8 family phage protein
MIVITAPAAEPVTLADVRTQLGILTADTASDTTITRRIIEARQYAERRQRRALITQTLQVRMDSFPCEFVLPNPPAASVSWVKYVNTDGVLTTVTATDYELDTYPLHAVVRPAYGVSWPVPRDESNAVRVQWVAGYGVDGTFVPASTREAIMLLVGHWMNFQPRIENGQFITRIPPAIDQLLDLDTADNLLLT